MCYAATLFWHHFKNDFDSDTLMTKAVWNNSSSRKNGKGSIADMDLLSQYYHTYIHMKTRVSVGMSKIKLCVHDCVHLPEAGPVSRTEPASCPWEMHHWPAAAKLGRMEGQ